MDSESRLIIKIAAYGKSLPPQSIRLKVGGWAGSAEKMQDGSEPQPWHCLPFVEASTYGLELIYPYETECQVVNDNGVVRFDWDYAQEPGGELSGGEFISFFPKNNSRYYLFSTRLDIQAPPGHVVRTEPHPRFFTDDTGTAPLAMIGHVQTEWWPKKFFVVFRAPRPGERHIFRKGEPYAQLLFVPKKVQYELTPMPQDLQQQRRSLEQAIGAAKSEIADNIWRNPSGYEFSNHYKILAAAFAQGDQAAVERIVGEGHARHQSALPADKTIAESLEIGQRCLDAHDYDRAKAIYYHVITRDPNNAEALIRLGICAACTGAPAVGLKMMLQAVSLRPDVASYRADLGQLLMMMNRPAEAETWLRQSLSLNGKNADVMSMVAMALAMQGRVAEGVQTCRIAVAMDPRSALAHYRLGLLLEQLQLGEEARVSYQAALEVDPAFEAARQALGASLLQRNEADSRRK